MAENGSLTETKKFETRKEMKDHLVGILRDLNKKGEFNILVHQINNYASFWFRGKNITEQKINGIFDYGLELKEYSSIFGTTNLACVSSSLDADAILDYNYYKNSHFPICVIAIPKFIDVDGEKTEFSTYKSHTQQAQAEIRNAFVSEGINVDRHHMKLNLLDVIKGYNALPTGYVVGVAIEQGQGYTFIENPFHLRAATKQEYQAYQDSVANKIKNAYDEYGTKDPAQLMIKSYQKEQNGRETSSLEDYD